MVNCKRSVKPLVYTLHTFITSKPTRKHVGRIVDIYSSFGVVCPTFLGGPNLRTTVHVLQTIYDYMPQNWDWGQTETIVWCV